MRGGAVLALVGACGGGPAAKPAGTRLGPALAAAMTAADHARAPWRCGASDGPALADETVELGGHAWKLAGHTMRREGASSLVIGVVADAGGAAPATLAALGRIRTELADADLVLALGGMGTQQPELEATLGVLADRAPFPVVALPGDLEAMPAATAAIAAMRARGMVVVDGRLAQTIELGDTTIATAAGMLAASRLVAGDDGCLLATSDLEAAIAATTARPGLRIFASAEAPRGSVDGEPTGDVAITVAPDRGIDLALYAPIGERVSAARSGRRGQRATLTPGTVDAQPRLPGPPRAATAGKLVVTGEAWSWKPITDAR